MNADTLVLGFAWYIVFLLSTTCHEAAHALVAKLGGDLTAFHGGQVSLDPIPHIRREPFGMVIFPILSYVTGGWMMGWASALTIRIGRSSIRGVLRGCRCRAQARTSRWPFWRHY